MVHQLDNALDPAPMPEYASMVEARSYYFTNDHGRNRSCIPGHRDCHVRVGMVGRQSPDHGSARRRVRCPNCRANGECRQTGNRRAVGLAICLRRRRDATCARWFVATAVSAFEYALGSLPANGFGHLGEHEGPSSALGFNRQDRSSCDAGCRIVVTAGREVCPRRFWNRCRGISCCGSQALGIYVAWLQGLRGAAARIELVELFARTTADWLVLRKDDVTAFRSSDDAFDSLIAALVARASALSLVESIDEGDRSFALREGWIALPLDGSLHELAHG